MLVFGGDAPIIHSACSTALNPRMSSQFPPKRPSSAPNDKGDTLSRLLVPPTPLEQLAAWRAKAVASRSVKPRPQPRQAKKPERR
ncbi:MAG TPA: hypothetical protein VMG12_24105 [Polyangiaceae bacterium]|nr:hypothetical protein [Polyangiaceae bacterium]